MGAADAGFVRFEGGGRYGIPARAVMEACGQADADAGFQAVTAVFFGTGGNRQGDGGIEVVGEAVAKGEVCAARACAVSYVAAVSGAVAEFAAVGAAAAQQVFSRAGALREHGGGVGRQQRQGGAGVGGICRADVEAAQVPDDGAGVAVVVFCLSDRKIAVGADSRYS